MPCPVDAVAGHDVDEHQRRLGDHAAGGPVRLGHRHAHGPGAELADGRGGGQGRGRHAAHFTSRHPVTSAALLQQAALAQDRIDVGPAGGPVGDDGRVGGEQRAQGDRIVAARLGAELRAVQQPSGRRRVEGAIGDPRVGAAGEQELDQRIGAVPAGEVQRRGAVLAALVDADARREQRSDAGQRGWRWRDRAAGARRRRSAPAAAPVADPPAPGRPRRRRCRRPGSGPWRRAPCRRRRRAACRAGASRPNSTAIA